MIGANSSEDFQMQTKTFAYPLVALAALGTITLQTPAQAQSGRFVMEKTDEGYVRMDTQSGAISICVVDDGQVICKMAADERAAFDADIAALEDRVAKLESQLGSGGALALKNNGLPTEEEFERGLGYMEKFMRRFMDITKDLEDDNNRT